MTKLEADIGSLREKAISFGATIVVQIAAADVVMDARVGLKCRVPLCSHFGRSFMCPPLCPSPEAFASGLSRYEAGLLVQAKVVADPASMGWLDRDATLGALAKDEGYLSKMNASMNAFSALMGRLERSAHELGYGFSLALSGGTCALCDECAAAIPGAACRHPFEARPSMEAVGIDVVGTARGAGIEIRFPSEDPSWTGLLLVE